MADHSYPVMLRLQGKRCVIVGGGVVAERKALALLETGASLTIVSPALTDRLHALVEAGCMDWRKKQFEPMDIHGAFLIFAATDQPGVNAAVHEAASPEQLVTLADRPDLSSFTVPAQLRRGKLLFTVSTEGASPGLSRKLIGEIAEKYDAAYEVYVDFLAETRRLILERVESPERRRRLFKQLLADEFLHEAGRCETRLWKRFAKLMQQEGEEDR